MVLVLVMLLPIRLLVIIRVVVVGLLLVLPFLGLEPLAASHWPPKHFTSHPSLLGCFFLKEFCSILRLLASFTSHSIPSLVLCCGLNPSKLLSAGIWFRVVLLSLIASRRNCVYMVHVLGKLDRIPFFWNWSMINPYLCKPCINNISSTIITSLDVYGKLGPPS